MNDEYEMTFWDHLESFRWVLFRCILFILLLSVISFSLMPYIYDRIIMAPTRPDFFLYKFILKISRKSAFFPDLSDSGFRIKIINIGLASQFLRQMSTSLYVALTFSFPYIIYELWRFIRPALYKEEKRNVRRIFVLGAFLFFAGCTVGYMLVFPLTFRFLASYRLSPSIENQISLDSYMDNFISLIFTMGLVFELPLLSWFLSCIGILKKSFFKKYRRHVIVALLIAAAVITPSGDPFTLFVVFIPLYSLFELSRFMVRK